MCSISKWELKVLLGSRIVWLSGYLCRNFMAANQEAEDTSRLKLRGMSMSFLIDIQKLHGTPADSVTSYSFDRT